MQPLAIPMEIDLMLKKTLPRAALSTLAIGLVLAFHAPAARAGTLDGARYLKQARVPLARARAIALRAVHGRIVAQELEKEPGGSGLRYSFDIRKGTTIHEVGVDARTGKVLEAAVEGPNPD